MPPVRPADPHRFVEAIRKSGLSIYSPIEIGDPFLWIPAPELGAGSIAGRRAQ